jgi:hypothetical protein
MTGVKVTGGRNAVFLPSKLYLVRRIAMEGYTDAQLAKIYGIPESTFEYWRAKYPDFDKALEEGRTEADGEVMVSLYQRATGYDYTEEVVAGKDPEVFTIKKHAIPDVAAQQFWLKHRKKAAFPDKQTHEVTGPKGKPLMPRESKADLVNAIVALIKPKPDKASGQ